MTLDYWDIEVTNAISTIGEQLILDKCAEEGEFCDKITRFGPSDGALHGNSIDIDDRTTNVGGVNSSGYDFNIRYTTDLGFGALKVNLDTTYYDTYDKIQADDSIVKHAGKYWDRSSGDGNFPEWKTNLNMSLQTDDYAVNYTVRYMSSVEEYVDFASSSDWDKSEINSSFRTSEVINNETSAVDGWDVYREVGSSTVHDVRFTYFMDNLTATVGVDNLFDKAPPFMASGFNDNTDPRTYNTTGRHMYVSLGLTF